MAKKYSYYVSFLCNNNAQFGYGSAEIRRDRPIASNEDIESIVELIGEDQSVSDITIINWRRFELPE